VEWTDRCRIGATGLYAGGPKSAIVAAYDGIASTGEVVVLINEYPPGNVRLVT
jgi:hypothetical protein